MSQKDKTDKTKVSIYLIKKGFDSQIIDLQRTGLVPKSISDTCTIYSYISKDHGPSWVRSFFMGKYLDDLHIKNVSVLVVISVQTREDGERYFALPFGYGVHLINKDSIEERFGLKTALNLTQKTDIRQIKKTNIAGVAPKTSEQMPRKSSISEFSIDPERDLLDAITVTVGDKYDIRGNATGSDSFSASVRFNLDEMNEFLISLFTDYRSKNYQNDFPWIDHISPVKKSNSLIGALEKEAVKYINKGSDQIWMAVPEIVEWDSIAGFRYYKTDELHDDINLNEVIHSFKRNRKIFENFDQLKHKYILGIDNLGNVKYKWTADKCLCGELTFGESQYCINNGNWFEIENAYAKDINDQYSYFSDEYKKTDTSEFEFIDFKGKDAGNENKYNEGEYNRDLARRTDSLLMDKVMIRRGGIYDQIELCDVLSKDGKFIHVKRYSGSATLSHLFNQGLVSAQLVKGDNKFLEKANKKIKEQKGGEQYSLKSESIKQIIFGIIQKGRGEGDLPNIPFFSKITFLYVKKQLELMNIEVKIKRIKAES